MLVKISILLLPPLIFHNILFKVTVPENSVSGTTVGWVEAFDRDSSLYGSEGVRYTALGGSIADK